MLQRGFCDVNSSKNMNTNKTLYYFFASWFSFFEDDNKEQLLTLEGLQTPCDWPRSHHVTTHQIAICEGRSHRTAHCPSARQLSC